MAVTYTTTILGFGNHAAIPIPDEVLTQLNTNRRAPLIITVGQHTYRSTATAMDGKCLVVFPQKERTASGVGAGDTVEVTLDLDSGVRAVEVPEELEIALQDNQLLDYFQSLSYSKRKEFARQVSEAKAQETKLRRIEKIIDQLKGSS